MKLSSIPQIYRHVGRWTEILEVLSKYGLATWIGRLGPNFAKDLLKARGGAAIARAPWDTRLRLAMAELGPTFIKLGQMLSTRPDLVGVKLADELRLGCSGHGPRLLDCLCCGRSWLAELSPFCVQCCQERQLGSVT
jgi:hypothetical protein